LATLLRLEKDIPEGEWADSEGNITRVMVTNPKLTAEWMYREDTQAICGIHTNRWGHTKRIRAKRGYEGTLPQKGESIMCCRNDKELGIFNGSFGTMIRDAVPTKRKSDNVMLDVRMEDLRAPINMLITHPYLFQQHYDNGVTKPLKLSRSVQEFDWSYVLTCHKSQGSEWEDVTVLDDGGIFRQDQWRWRYTAATRASKRLTFLKRA
jgi:exodeoxyribonuclease-5